MNAIVVINIGLYKPFKILKKSIDKYCKKYNIEFEILTEPKYNLVGNDAYHYRTFEKNQVYELFDKYERIIRLDYDVLISPTCPNLFKIVPEDEIGVVFEDEGSRKPDRRRLIKHIQNIFGNVNWSEGYFNSGIVIASKQHREIFKFTEEEKKKFTDKSYRGPKEQSFLNFRVRKLNFKICQLDFRFNHMSVFSEPWNLFANKFNSYLIHYAGTVKEDLIKTDYKKFFYNIKKPIEIKEIKYFFIALPIFIKKCCDIILIKKKPISYRIKLIKKFLKNYIIHIRYVLSFRAF